MSERILEVRDLNIYKKDNNDKIVNDLNLHLDRGESLGIVGESGSGKTMVLKSLMDLLPEEVYEEYGLKEIHGNMGMVFQNPMRTLDPFYPVSRQLKEIYLRYHDTGEEIHRRESFGERLTRLIAGAKVSESLRASGEIKEGKASKWVRMICEKLNLPEDILDEERYPRTLSGGQCQRVGIAMALACDPEILLCDEPTTALDMSIQRNTLELIKELKSEYGLSIIFVTHNPMIASKICERIIVLKDGKISY